jgi:hypothetical protein
MPATATAYPNCGGPNVWKPKSKIQDQPASWGRFVLGVLAALLIAAVMAFLWALWPVAVP